MCPYWGDEQVRAQPDPNPAPYLQMGLSYGPLMQSAPRVLREFSQDEFKTQADRIGDHKY
jgi:hypothetical protein